MSEEVVSYVISRLSDDAKEALRARQGANGFWPQER